MTILFGKNLAATMPAAPNVAFPGSKLLQVPLIVRYLTKLVGASAGTFCEVQKLGGCSIGFKHWSNELPKFRLNGGGSVVAVRKYKIMSDRTLILQKYLKSR